jgi:general secretion pathway protein D
MWTSSWQGANRLFSPPRTASWLVALAVFAALGGCATTGVLGEARRAEEQMDYDRAVVEYTRALQLDPGSVAARTGLQRAKLRASQEHFTRARRLAALGRLDEAIIDYQLAAEMNPNSSQINQELQDTQNLLRAKVVVNRNGKTELEALVERMRDQPPLGLELPAEPLPESLTFKGPNDTIIRALAQLAKVNVLFDPAFIPSAPIQFDARNETFDTALKSITASTRNFFRVTAPRTITVIPDTPAKRREYEEEVVRTFYLSNGDLKETSDLLRIVIDARRIGVIAGTNAITIHDTPERIEAAARLISMIDKARPEVLIDVELLEVNRVRLQEYGLQLASPNSAGINGVADVNKTGLTLDDLRNLKGSQILMTSVPGLYYRLLKEDESTRVLANPQLRTLVGASAQARFGERVPVPVTTFSPIATGGVNQQPITSYNYENIGVNIDITPRIHLNNEVTLALTISVTSISGTGFGSLPTFGNREIKTQIRLKDGETNMLAGLIRDDERRTRDGIPGLSDIPGVGHLFGHSTNERTQTDVILMLTPRIVRVLDLTEEDLRAFQMGRDSGASAGGPVGGPAGGIELPLPDAAPDPEEPQEEPGEPAGPARPLMPPVPQPQPGAAPGRPTPPR